MGIEKDIQRLLAGVLDKHGGNKASAAESLDINAVTFWGWATGKRKPLGNALCKALDNAGGKLLLPGELLPRPPDQTQELEALQKENMFLTRENALLHKLVNKYEAEDHEKKEAPEDQKSDQIGSAHALGSRQAKDVPPDVATRS